MIHKENAIALLKAVALRPGMYVQTHGEAICIASTALCILVPNFDTYKFYGKHIQIRGCAYISMGYKVKIPKDEWLEGMMEDAIRMLSD